MRSSRIKSEPDFFRSAFYANVAEELFLKPKGTFYLCITILSVFVLLETLLHLMAKVRIILIF